MRSIITGTLVLIGLIYFNLNSSNTYTNKQANEAHTYSESDELYDEEFVVAEEEQTNKKINTQTEVITINNTIPQRELSQIKISNHNTESTFLNSGLSLEEIAFIQTPNENPIFQELNLSSRQEEEIRTVHAKMLDFLTDQFSKTTSENPSMNLNSNPTYVQMLEDYQDALSAYLSEEDAAKFTNKILNGDLFL